MGYPREAYTHINQAFELGMRLELFSSIAEVLAYAVEALVQAEEWQQAHIQLSRAFELAAERKERIYLVQMYILQSKIAGKLSHQKESTTALANALDEARSLGSPWLITLALVEKFESGETDAKLLLELQSACSHLVGANETALWKRASNFLPKI